jgi:hypothetical protein
MQKDKPPSVLGEALLDAVIARRPPKDYRPKRPHQPANTFVGRSGEIASAPDTPAPMKDKGRGGPLSMRFNWAAGRAGAERQGPYSPMRLPFHPPPEPSSSSQ